MLIQTVGSVSVAITLIISVFQLRNAHRQLAATIRTSLNAGGLQIFERLESSEAMSVRSAARKIDPQEVLDQKNVDTIDKLSRLSDTVGAMARADAIPLDILIMVWGGGILRDWVGLVQPYVQARLRPTFPLARSNYEWLARRMYESGWRLEGDRILRVDPVPPTDWEPGGPIPWTPP